MNPEVWSRKILRDGTPAWRNELELPSKEWLHVPQIAATEIGRRLGNSRVRSFRGRRPADPFNISARTQEIELLNLIPSPPQLAGGETTAPDLGTCRGYEGLFKNGAAAHTSSSQKHHALAAAVSTTTRRHSVRRRDAKLHKGKTYH
jgi:hypothetical protein